MSTYFLYKIFLAAERNHIEIFKDNSNVKTSFYTEVHWPDGRRIKFCPKGVYNTVLLEIEVVGGNYKIYSHRTYELTQQHKNKFVKEQWIIDFIEHNKFIAKEASKKYLFEAEEEKKQHINTVPLIISYKKPEVKEKKVQYTKAEPLSEEEMERRRSERNNVSCSCMGEVENCAHCFGQGYYITNGFGRKI